MAENKAFEMEDITATSKEGEQFTRDKILDSMKVQDTMETMPPLNDQGPRVTDLTSNRLVIQNEHDLIHVVSNTATEKNEDVMKNGGMGKDDDSDADEDVEKSTCQQSVTDCGKYLLKLKLQYFPIVSRGVKYIILFLYLCYFGYAMYHEFGTEPSLRLFVCTVIGVLIFIYSFINKYIYRVLARIKDLQAAARIRSGTKWLMYIAMIVFAVVYIVMNVGLKKPSNLSSLAGMAAYLIISLVMSNKISKINWRCVFWGISIQFLLAIVILRTAWGLLAITWISDRIEELLDYGHLASRRVFGATHSEHALVFDALPLIFFINAFITMLYHVGAMQWIVTTIGSFLAFALSCTPAESISVAANIFLGNSQASLAIYPFLSGMSSSEVFALMVGGFASVSTSVMGLYIQFGAEARHIITACILSAPASLAVAKIIYPDNRKHIPQTIDYSKLRFEKYNNVIEAAASGATASIKVFVQVLINIYVFYALLAFLDTTVAWFGHRVGIPEFSFKYVCSYLLFPLPLLMGASIDDCRLMAKILSVKLMAGNTLAFLMLGQIKDNYMAFLDYTSNPNNTWHYTHDDIVLDGLNRTLIDGVISPRSVAITTYALTGFSNFSSIGISLGTMMVLIPTKKQFLSRVMVRCMVAGNIACYLTACVAGLFFDT